MRVNQRSAVILAARISIFNEEVAEKMCMPRVSEKTRSESFLKPAAQSFASKTLSHRASVQTGFTTHHVKMIYDCDPSDDVNQPIFVSN